MESKQHIVAQVVHPFKLPHTCKWRLPQCVADVLVHTDHGLAQRRERHVLAQSKMAAHKEIAATRTGKRQPIGHPGVIS